MRNEKQIVVEENQVEAQAQTMNQLFVELTAEEMNLVAGGSNVSAGSAVK